MNIMEPPMHLRENLFTLYPPEKGLRRARNRSYVDTDTKSLYIISTRKRIKTNYLKLMNGTASPILYIISTRKRIKTCSDHFQQ